MVVFQTTGGAADAPGASREAAACCHASLVTLGPRPVQRLHQALRRQGHAALVALQWFVVTVASPGEVGTGLCTSTSGPIGGSTCSDITDLRQRQDS